MSFRAFSQPSLLPAGIAVVAVCGCDVATNEPPPEPLEPAPVSVSVSPSSPTVVEGGQLQFTATVQCAPEGETCPQTVTWSVTPIGIITPLGLFSLPESLPAQSLIAVHACAAALSSVCGLSEGRAVLRPQIDSLVVSPAAVSLSVGATQRFTAVVFGRGNFSQTVRWSVQAAPGWRGDAGTVVSTQPTAATYTAPTPKCLADSALFTIRAVSDAADSIADTVAVTVSDPREGCIAFIGTNQDVVALRPDGTDRVTLISSLFEPYTGGHLRWSPDGKTFAYSYNAGIWVINADGTEPRRIIGPPTVDWAYGSEWHPSGTKLAFWGRPTFGAPIDLFSVNVDGTGLLKLTSRPLSNRFCDSSWSPDGSKLAYCDGVGYASVDIWVIDEDGSNRRNLTPSAGGGQPVWSPDGTMIAFTRSSANGSSGVWVMNEDGTGQRQLTFPIVPAGEDGSTINDFAATWAPDTRRLAFLSIYRIDPTTGVWKPGADVFVVNVDGTGLVNLTMTDGTWAAGAPSWQRKAP